MASNLRAMAINLVGRGVGFKSYIWHLLDTGHRQAPRPDGSSAVYVWDRLGLQLVSWRVNQKEIHWTIAPPHEMIQVQRFE